MRYLVLIVVLAAAVVAAWMLLPEERRESLFEQVPQEAAEELSEGRDSRPSTGIYRWEDERGRTHYGQRPPPGVEAEMVEQRGVPAPPEQDFSDTE